MPTLGPQGEGGRLRVWDLNDEETQAAIERAEVIVDKDFVETQKRVKALHDMLSVHRDQIDAVRTELEPHRERLARIAERVQVPREELVRVQKKLKPEQAALDEALRGAAEACEIMRFKVVED